VPVIGRGSLSRQHEDPPPQWLAQAFERQHRALYARRGMKQRQELPIVELREFCTRWNIRELCVFGSYLREDFGPQSDVDFLATFAPDARWSLFDEVTMIDELERIVGRKVDLVARDALARSQNYIRRDEILSTARTLYAA
jgi:predicted nucleotidyltransferase